LLPGRAVTHAAGKRGAVSSGCTPSRPKRVPSGPAQLVSAAPRGCTRPRPPPRREFRYKMEKHSPARRHYKGTSGRSTRVAARGCAGCDTAGTKPAPEVPVMGPQLRTVLGKLQRLAGRDPAGPLTDAELLGRYQQRRDEAAFEALVWRHGPMVLGVCR